jgi:uncharacterized RmlC-like cupin family protein
MTQEVTSIIWEPPTPERENGPWHISPSSFVPAQDFEEAVSMVVEFGPTSWAGNHRHIEKEMLICLVGDMYLIWRDKNGARHEEKMLEPDRPLRAFLIDSNVPHLMENRSNDTFGTVQVWSGPGENKEPILLEGTESLR